jgi:hypothetical protein
MPSLQIIFLIYLFYFPVYKWRNTSVIVNIQYLLPDVKFKHYLSFLYGRTITDSNEKCLCKASVSNVSLNVKHPSLQLHNFKILVNMIKTRKNSSMFFGKAIHMTCERFLHISNITFLSIFCCMYLLHIWCNTVKSSFSNSWSACFSIWFHSSNVWGLLLFTLYCKNPQR